MKSLKISIIGCGWLGKPLAKSLSKEHQILCYSRKETSDASLNYIYKPDASSDFYKSEIIIIAINTKDNYIDTLKTIATNASKASTIIMMSSISVYREFDKEVDENTIITKVGLQKEAEKLIQGLKKNLIILRLGGLMGDNRISGKWKSASTFSDGYVNYVHKDDVIAIVKKLIQTDIQNGIYNVVAPLYPLRSQVHQKNSQRFGFKLGAFEEFTNRKVLSIKIIKELEYLFIHPNPLNFWDKLNND